MEFMMTIERIARQEGIEIGEKRAERRAEASMLTRLIKYKFSNISADKIEYLHNAPHSELLKIEKRLLKANRVEDIFKERG